jgi:16S rRNA (adenine1518-N6/adenine1519-N6)-dimethyltransferase
VSGREDLIRRLEAAGVRPRRPLGQNFLTDANLLAAILRDAHVDKDDVILEIGTGTAALTLLLAAAARSVVGVELDPALAELTRERIAGLENVKLIEGDALADKAHLSPVVVEAWREALAAAGAGAHAKIVANLPYAVSTPIVIHALELDMPVERITVMVQLEVAERFVAAPGDPQHNATSVLVQRLSSGAKILRRIPPDVFWPKPKVASAIVEIIPREARGAKDPIYPAFRAIVRAVFNYRRKTIATAAKSAAKRDERLACVVPALESAGIERERRAESLTQDEWTRLAEKCAKELASVEVASEDDE